MCAQLSDKSLSMSFICDVILQLELNEQIIYYITYMKQTTQGKH